MDNFLKKGIILGVLLLSACEVPNREPQNGMERDSAGVRILELPDAEAGVRTYEFSVDPSWDPASGLEIGDLLDIDLTPDGGILLLDELAGTILLVSESGEVLASIGHEGEGPGEFNPQGLSQVIATDSSVFVPDLFLQRLTEFQLDGEVLGMETFPFSPVYAVDWRRHPDGSLVFRAFEQFGDGVIRVGGERVDTLLYLSESNDFGNLLLAPITLWDIGINGNPVVARTNRAAVEARRAGTGQLLWRAQWPQAVEEVDEIAVNRLEGFVRDRILRDAPGISAELLAQNLASIEYPTESPVLAGLLSAENGDLWVRRAKPVHLMGPECLQVGSAEAYGGSEWDVLTPIGFLKARVRLPDGFSPRRFRGEWIYGILADEMGIETVARVGVSF
jgi:hypothetical protein